MMGKGFTTLPYFTCYNKDPKVYVTMTKSTMYKLKLIQLYQIRLRPTNVNITPSDPQKPNVSSIHTGPITLHLT